MLLLLALAILGPLPGSLGSGPTMRYAPGNYREERIGRSLLVHKFNMIKMAINIINPRLILN